jgi:hypothetical protein
MGDEKKNSLKKKIIGSAFKRKTEAENQQRNLSLNKAAQE